jgi:hypothetical protein
MNTLKILAALLWVACAIGVPIAFPDGIPALIYILAAGNCAVQTGLRK